MGAGAEPDVGVAGPVGAVVYGFMARQGPVGDLVVDVSGLAQPPADPRVLRGALLLRRLGVASGADPGAEGAALLDAELVGADVLGPHVQDPVQGRIERRYRELRQAEDQVQAEVGDAGTAQDADRLPGAGRVVSAVHPAEDPVVERLHAHADAVHAQVQQVPHVVRAFLHDVLGVHLDGEFRERSLGNAPRHPQGADNPAQVRRIQDGRGAASDIQGMRIADCAGIPLPSGDLGAERFRISFE